MIDRTNIILKVIPYYLLNFNSLYNRILELSLISKEIFKSFQEEIVKCSEKNKFKFYLSMNQFLKYIDSSVSNKYNKEKDTMEIQHLNYHCKLIQYYHLTRIRVSNITELDSKSLKIIHCNSKYYNIAICCYLNTYCKELTTVVLLDQVEYNFNFKYDFTCKGFYKVKILSTIGITEGLTRILTDGTIVSSENKHIYDIRLYNPSKFIISVNDQITVAQHGKSFGDSFNFGRFIFKRDLETILKCKSLKSIAFKDHIISLQLFSLILNSYHSKIKSIELTDIPRINCFNSNESILTLLNSSSLSNNSTLKQLLINRSNNINSLYMGKNISVIENIEKKEINSLFNSIKKNSSLNTIGLQGFIIRNSNYLSPLINISNITTIVCDSLNLKMFLVHCIENSNIKELLCITNKYYTIIDKFEFDIVDKFLKGNSGSLNSKSIIFTNNFNQSKSFHQILFEIQ